MNLPALATEIVNRMSKEDISPEEIEQEQHKAQDDQQAGAAEHSPGDKTEEANHEFGEAETADPVEELEKNLQAEKDRYLRLYAEFENFRRRNARERIDLIQSAASDLMKELLPVLDDFDRARKSNETADSIDSVKEGFDLLHHKLQNILRSKGLEIIESMGEEFNSEIHEAIARIEAEAEKKGKIIDVVEEGYKLNDKIIRHPKVVVGS